MDQAAIGRFIAAVRRERELTQRELAERLGISDKTVSKWECGNGLPEVSLMLPLCEALQISVNELLSVERLSAADYRIKAEENIMNLMEQNAENRKKLVLSIIVGVTCVIAFVSLALLAALLDIPTAVRIVLIVAAIAVAVFGIGAAATLDREAGTFECPICNARFVPAMKEYVKGAHTITKRRLTCPECGKTSMCRHRVTK